MWQRSEESSSEIPGDGRSSSPWAHNAGVVQVVRHQVRTGTYRPPDDDVAEQLVAWLFADRMASMRAAVA